MQKDRKSRKPNELLRHERQRRGWSQSKLAELIGADPTMISRWETGEREPDPAYQEKLCTLFDKDAVELGFIERLVPWQPEQSYNNESQRSYPLETEDEPATIAQENAEDDDMNRRQALQIFSVAGVSFIVGDPSTIENLQEIEARFNRRTMRLHTWLLDGLERETHLRWHLYYTSSNSQAEQGLLKQIDRLEQIADDDGPHQRRAYSLLAQGYQLAGSLARDNFSYIRAKNYFEQAYQVAQEAGITDLATAALVRWAVVYMRQENFAEALSLYQKALNMAKRAEPQVKAYVCKNMAEAYARNGYHKECYLSLDQAENLLVHVQSVSPEDDIAQVRLTFQSVEDTRGECFVLCGEPVKGLEYLQEAQKRLDQTISRNHCRLLMQQSEAHLALGSPDHSAQFALDGLQLARLLGSKGNIHWASEIHTKLLKAGWGGEPAVKDLELSIKAK